jgi:hypothetical protein
MIVKFAQMPQHQIPRLHHNPSLILEPGSVISNLDVIRLRMGQLAPNTSMSIFNRSRATVHSMALKPWVACCPWNPMSRSALLSASR